jgi:hypothetical protein
MPVPLRPFECDHCIREENRTADELTVVWEGTSDKYFRRYQCSKDNGISGIQLHEINPTIARLLTHNGALLHCFSVEVEHEKEVPPDISITDIPLIKSEADDFAIDIHQLNTEAIIALAVAEAQDF